MGANVKTLAIGEVIKRQDMIILHNELPNVMKAVFLKEYRNKILILSSKLDEEQESQVISKVIEMRRNNPQLKMLIL